MVGAVGVNVTSPTVCVRSVTVASTTLTDAPTDWKRATVVSDTIFGAASKAAISGDAAAAADTDAGTAATAWAAAI